MEKKKLELKHLSAYLPYGLKVRWAERPGNIKKETILTPSDYNWLTHKGYFKPILRPLSDLTKTIEINGEQLVPIDVLSEISGLQGGANRDLSKWESRCFEYDDENKSFKTTFYDSGLAHDYATKDDRHVDNQLELFQKLYEWHFDVFNLIEQGLAIDINTLSHATNPH